MTATLAARRGPSVVGPAGRVIGRETELATLRTVLEDDGPRVLFVHGIGGVGKSTLVEAFSAKARAEGARVIALDGGGIAPTARGFSLVMEESNSEVTCATGT